MARCVNNLWKYNCPDIKGSITGRLAPKLPTPKWTVEQALAFLAEESYPPSEAARIAQGGVK